MLYKLISVFVAIVILVSSGAATTASAAPTSNNTVSSCLHYTDHKYEVCTAYIANSSLAVLLPYYMYARSSNPSLAGYVSYRLNARYVGQANSIIRTRVSSWPVGATDVAIPDITILSVQSSLATNTATLVTRESWHITTESGAVLCTENNAVHTITMHRVPSYLLHKWVVADIK
jgi:hypothetical protein